MEKIPAHLLKSLSYIGGKWVPAVDGSSFEVTNPANGLIISEVSACGKIETKSAVSAAATAFDSWKATSAYQRAALLNKIAALMREDSQALARLITLEQGKPIREAAAEILYAASFFEWFAEEAKRNYGQTIPATQTNKRLIIIKQPLGICAAITPWNFPSAMIARKIAPALAAGNTVIVKPAPETPLSALAIAAIAERADLPAGVLNVITGPAEPIAQELLSSPLVRHISFTGSTEVGKILMRQSADTLKRITLELGGNAPLLVFEDADIAHAAEQAVLAKYRNAGQTCICVNRILVHEKVADEFTEYFSAATRKLRVGNGLDSETDIGPLISSEAMSKVCSLINEACAQGAQKIMGGEPDAEQRYLYPTILTKVTESMRISQEEIFGPVATIQTFTNDAEAIAKANATEYGLASYIFTKDLSRAINISEALEYGMVGINDTNISNAQAPFGGVKQSGFGREGGHWGLEEYSQVKYISLAL